MSIELQSIGSPEYHQLLDRNNEMGDITPLGDQITSTILPLKPIQPRIGSSSIDYKQYNRISDTGNNSTDGDVNNQYKTAERLRDRSSGLMQTKLSHQQRYGRRGTVTLLAMSMTSLLGAIGMLSFLWCGNSSNHVWYQIVVQNWMTRTAALMALAIRISVSLQAGMATSMLAAIILENLGIRLVDVIELTVARYTEPEPYSLLLICLRDWKFRVYTTLLVSLSFSTFATQFASTLLLSDINSAMVPRSASNESVLHGFRFDNIDASYILLPQGQQYQRVTPSSFEAFAEYWEPPNAKEGVDDTGLTLRSFLPFSNQTERERLREYKGPALVYDTRVVCVQPQFKSLGIQGSNGQRENLYGEVAPRTTTSGLVSRSTNVIFNCTLYDKDSPSSILWILCGLDLSAGGLISPLDPSNNSSLTHKEINSDGLLGPYWAAGHDNISWPVDLGGSYLLLNFQQYDRLRYSLNYSVPFLNYRSSYVGPWSNISIHIPRTGVWDEKDIKFSASICYDAM